LQQVFEAARNRLDRRERIISALPNTERVAATPDAPPPAKPAQIRQYKQLMRHTTLAKAGPPNPPTPNTARKRSLNGPDRLLLEAGCQSQFFSRASEQLLARPRHQFFPATIHEPQPLILVEGEDRHFDFGHHGAQQTRCFHGPEPLSRKVSASVFTSLTSSPRASSRLGPRARVEKSPSRIPPKDWLTFATEIEPGGAREGKAEPPDDQNNRKHYSRL